MKKIFNKVPSITLPCQIVPIKSNRIRKLVFKFGKGPLRESAFLPVDFLKT